MRTLFDEIKQQIDGDVHEDLITRAIYSVDASIYELLPLGIVIPKNSHSLIKTIEIAFKHKIPVTARGAATGITGGCLGTGLIIDTSKYLNKILEINFEEKYVICEPGVVQDRLNEALGISGYRLGPDTSTGNRATIGGMLANNSAGARSLIYGCMVDHIKEVELILSNGETLFLKTISEEEWTKKMQLKTIEGNIYREIFRLINTHRKTIEEYFPKIPRHVSGYNLDRLLSSTLNLSQLVAGSEGTLGIATKIKMSISKKPLFTGACVIHLETMIPAMHHIEDMLAFHPIALEMIDDKIINAARNSPSVRTKLDWLQGSPQGVFIAEFDASSQETLDSKLNEFAKYIHSISLGYAYTILNTPQKTAAVWEVRKAGLGLLLSKREYSRAIAFIEDLSIAPAKLAHFMEDFCKYIHSIGKEAGIYGHIGSGCMHIRPYIDLRKKEEISKMKKILNDISEMVLAYGGAMSGEHGDGFIRSWLNEKMFGPDLYQAFKDIKKVFDPHNLMNPGKIVNGPDFTENLRLSPKSQQKKISTFLDFSNEGGIELAADLCNGNGLCRKKETLMCPSFQASGDEYHSTRARAQTLRSIIHGIVPFEELTSKGMLDVLDLCIECKGCKKECPSLVDMAKMKSEILFQHQEKHGYSLRNKLFANLPRFNKLASPFATVFNKFSTTKLSKMIQNWLGITPERTLPQFSQERFSKWFYKQLQPQKNKKVVLFNDTYTEFNEPGIGQAAFKILSALGYEIILADRYCCGRPFISKGFLKEAKNNAIKVIKNLNQVIDQNLQIIVLEPSCASAFRDDYSGLLGDNPILQRVASQTLSLDEFLQSHLIDGKLSLPFKNETKNVWVHVHCHHKSLIGKNATLQVLKGIKGFTVNEIESGCCGMAGSFGYEKEHYRFSMKIGELKLFPTIRSLRSNDLIIANGMSCRCQIYDGTKYQAFHLAEVVADHMANELI
jgi:FAD/FMN-containing dehydrogenase/Fe-S oxidoreductase